MNGKPTLPADAAPSRPTGSRALPGRLDRVLVCIVLAGGLLRFWGIAYGLPHVYNPDESSILLRALSLGAGSLNPHNFLYPSLYLYVLAAATGAFYLVLHAAGLSPSLAAFEAAFLIDPTGVYLVARGISAAAGTATILATYVLARRVGNRTFARVAAALFAFSYIPVRDAHFVKHDVPVTLLLVLVVLAAEQVWRRGRTADYVRAGALVGAALAFHYYAVFGAVALVVAHALRSRNVREFVASRRIWLAGGAIVVAFACLSPYVLLDIGVAARDIAANRQIVVSRGFWTYGPLGAGLEHLRLMATQGAGVVMLAAAGIGVVLLARESPAAAALVWSFPFVYFLFISNAWPFGRLQNPLYPFVAVAAAAGIVRLGRAWRSPGSLTALATAASVLQPAALAVTMDRLMAATDTRTLAAEWIEASIPAGAVVTLQPYSVPLVPTRDSLREALAATVGSADRASRRFRAQLALDPYPAPAYRLIYLGRGLDQDKRYVETAGRTPPEVVRVLRGACVSVVALKRFSQAERDELGDELDRVGRRLWSVSPFNEGKAGAGTPAQLPDYDIRPSRATIRPGPAIVVWELPASPPPCSAP